MLAAGAVLAVGLIAGGARPTWLLLAFPLFLVGALGIVQARERT
jgi:hypothetical protein